MNNAVRRQGISVLSMIKDLALRKANEWPDIVKKTLLCPSVFLATMSHSNAVLLFDVWAYFAALSILLV